MCLVVYIASSEILPTSEWEQGKGVAICALRQKDTDVRKQFRHPNVYYVASSEGCGCGFLTHYKEGSELQSALDERKTLSQLLRDSTSPNQQVQLLISYDGYERNEVDTRWKVSIDDLESCDFNKGWDYHVIVVDVDLQPELV